MPARSTHDVKIVFYNAFYRYENTFPKSVAVFNRIRSSSTWDIHMYILSWIGSTASQDTGSEKS